MVWEVNKMLGIAKVPIKRRGEKSLRLTFMLLSISILLAGVSLLASKPRQIQAKPLQVASNWRYASFPVENFQSYTSPFGHRINPVTGEKQFHQGLDLAAPLGSYVRNWWSGEVFELSDHTSCGTLIKIRSGQWTHVYCHLMGSVENTERGQVLVDRHGGIFLWKGQQVPAGARIGRVGVSGRTTGPHLHWGLMYRGKYVDPATVLRQMFAQQI